MCVCRSVCVRESECIFCLLMWYNAAFISYHSLFCAPVLVGQCSNATVCTMCRGKQVMHLYPISYFLILSHSLFSEHVL